MSTEDQPENRGTEYEMWEGCHERVDSRAFNRAISERQDIICDVNHSHDALLGRTSSNTLRLSVDSVGLRYECDLPDTSEARDCAALIARGDIAGSSFAFIARSSDWLTNSDGSEVRTLIDVDLIDVGPVTFPAYAATTTSARAEHGSVEIERAEWRANKQREADAVAMAVAMVSIDM